MIMVEYLSMDAPSPFRLEAVAKKHGGVMLKLATNMFLHLEGENHERTARAVAAFNAEMDGVGSADAVAPAPRGGE